MTIAIAPPSQIQSLVYSTGPCEIVIFGSAGDLTKRLLLPAFYNLKWSNFLSQEFAIVGVAHTAMSQDGVRSKLNQERSRRKSRN